MPWRCKDGCKIDHVLVFESREYENTYDINDAGLCERLTSNPIKWSKGYDKACPKCYSSVDWVQED